MPRDALVVLTLAAVGLGGCGRIHYDRPFDADARVANPDGPPRDGRTVGSMPCSAWGPWSEPEVLPGVNSSPHDEWGPHISSDGATLLFESWREDGAGEDDLWLATRPSVDAGFDPPRPLTAINSRFNETSPVMSGDALEVFYAHARGGDADLFRSKRSDVDADFPAGTRVDELSGDGDVWPVELSPDGRDLYIVQWSGRLAAHSVFVTTRTSRVRPFGEPELVETISSTEHDTEIALSSDTLEVFVSTERDGGRGGYDIWRADRPTTDAPFSEPVPVTELNTARDDIASSLSTDGTTLYLSWDTDVWGGLDAELMIARRTCRD